jgi:hypothetical protein
LWKWRQNLASKNRGKEKDNKLSNQKQEWIRKTQRQKSKENYRKIDHSHRSKWGWITERKRKNFKKSFKSFLPYFLLVYRVLKVFEKFEIRLL